MSANSPYVRYVLGLLGGVRKAGSNGWFALCSVHTERTGSLHITEAQDGAVLVKCHGCGAGLLDVVKAAGGDLSRCLPEKAPAPRSAFFAPNGLEFVRAYVYEDADGRNYMRVRRMLGPSGKTFLQDRWEGDRWKAGLAGRPTLLYHLPEVLEAIRDGVPVWLFEGEKDADNARRWGLVATTAPMGTDAFTEAHANSLRGALLRIVPDNDAPGRKHAQQAAHLCHGKAQSLRVVDLPGLTEKGADFSDWQAQELGCRETLERLADQAPEWVPADTCRVEVADAEPEEEFTLPLSLEAVQPFPVRVLPAPVRALIEATAAALPAPADFVGVPVLSALAAAIGNSRCLLVKEGWRERAVLWTVVVGRPGDAKSPALHAALEPVKERQRRLMAQYQGKLETYQEDRAEYERELSAFQAKARKHARGELYNPGEPPVPPEEPRPQQVSTNNATLEALNHLLYQNPRGLIFYRDEVIGWVGDMNAYRGGKGGDRQAWLEFWSSAAVTVNRRAEKTALQLDGPFICVTGGVQPDVLPELLEGTLEDGFLHRILFAFPDPVPIEWTDHGIPSDVRHSYQAVIDALYALRPAEEETGIADPQELRFTPEGYQTWVRWIRAHLAEMNHPDFPDHLRGPWAKLKGYAARLALVMHLTRYVCHETDSEHVDQRSMLAAAALVTYFKSHLRRVYLRLRASDEDKQLTRLMEWLRDRGGQASARDICRAQVAELRTADAAQTAMRALENRGWAAVETGARNSLTVRLLQPKSAEVSGDRSHVSGEVSGAYEAPVSCLNGTSCRVSGEISAPTQNGAHGPPTRHPTVT